MFWNTALTLAAAAAVLAIVPALALEHRRRRLEPTTRAYAWGYFQGVAGVLMGGGLVVMAMLSPDAPLLFAIAWGLGLVGSGWFVIRRYRWAWVTLTALSLNPFLWFAGVIYGRNRWAELKPLSRPDLERPGAQALQRRPASRRDVVLFSVAVVLVLALIVPWALGSYNSAEDSESRALIGLPVWSRQFLALAIRNGDEPDSVIVVANNGGVEITAFGDTDSTGAYGIPIPQRRPATVNLSPKAVRAWADTAERLFRAQITPHVGERFDYDTPIARGRSESWMLYSRGVTRERSVHRISVRQQSRWIVVTVSAEGVVHILDSVREAAAVWEQRLATIGAGSFLDFLTPTR